MSIHCLSHVMRHSDAQLGARLVLFVLAEHAHDDGSNAFPTVPTIVERTRLSRRAVQSALRRLEADQMIHAAGIGPNGQTNYRVVMGGEDSAPLPDGGVVDDAPGRSSRHEGGEAASPNPSVNPSETRQDDAGARVAEVWAHYQAVMPNGMRYQLTPARRLLISNALKVRSVDECQGAITGLSRSEYHVANDYLDLKYALLGGGRSPSVEATVDRLNAQSRRPAASVVNGGGMLKSKGYSGRSWDELTRREQENVKEATAMGLEVWDGGKDAYRDQVPMAVMMGPGGSGAIAAVNGNGRGVLTAENFGDPDD